MEVLWQSFQSLDAICKRVSSQLFGMPRRAYDKGKPGDIQTVTRSQAETAYWTPNCLGQ